MHDVDVVSETDAETATKGRKHELLSLPHLFLLLECGRLSAGGCRHELAQIDHVRLGRGTRRSATRSFVEGTLVLDLRVPDSRMSHEHGRIARVDNGFLFEDLGSTNGSWVDGTPVTAPVFLNNGSVIEIGRTLFRFRSGLPTPAGTPADLDGGAPSDADGRAFATLLPSLAGKHAALAKVAASRIPVLLQGETGTGKEVVARAIHAASGRKGPFVAVNCGAIPATLVEAQLFGHKRGAFSGATSDALGFVRASHDGTLFLDEIGDLPMPAQAALLRVLQEGEVVPVGAARPEWFDLRVLCATHHNLQDAVNRGTFRPDLLARVAGLTHELLPLRERIEDLGLLVATILARIAPERHRAGTLTRDAARSLVTHHWPLNVRELESSLSLATVLAGDAPIDVEHLRASEDGGRGRLARHSQGDDALRERLVQELRSSGGNVAAVARAMGKARMQVQRWMKRFKVDPKAFRER